MKKEDFLFNCKSSYSEEKRVTNNFYGCLISEAHESNNINMLIERDKNSSYSHDFII